MRKNAEYIPNMRYITYYVKPNEFGDEQISGDCETIKEALEIIKKTCVKQGLIIIDHTQKYGYKRII